MAPVLVESLFFVLGVIPWWIICWMPQKTLPYWLIYVWVCLLWLLYYGLVHPAPMGIVNNVIELVLATWGIRRFARKPSDKTTPSRV